MASKYLASGTATFTAATRAITGATMTAGFVSGDAGRGITFVKDGAVYFGTIAGVTSGTDITLAAGAGLPATNGTITQLIVIDTSKEHSYQDFLTELESKVPQDIEKIDLAGRKAVLAEALEIYNEDRPYVVPIRVAGTGSDELTLITALAPYWKPGKSAVQDIEYPVNQKPPAFIEDEDYRIYSDGTVQDGTTDKLIFLDTVPGSGEYFVVHVRTPRILDEVTGANFPDTGDSFNELTTLAGALLCERLAAAFAQSSNAAITADVVDYHGKTEKYRALAKDLRGKYNLAVFGAREGDVLIQPALIEKPIDTTNSMGSSYLFHGRRR